MAALLAAESIRLVAGAATELSNAELFQCTEKFVQRLDQGHTFSNHVIQEAVDGSAKLFRTSFNRFSVDALPCTWNDLGLADFHILLGQKFCGRPDTLVANHRSHHARFLGPIRGVLATGQWNQTRVKAVVIQLQLLLL